MENQNPVSENLPKLLILRPPHIINLFEDQFSDKFQLLKPWESPIPTDQFLAAHCASVEAMLISGLTPITADVLRRLPLLRLICTTSAGLNHIDLPECRRRGVSIANAGSAYSEDVADLAVALLIDVLRRVSAADRFVRDGVWPIKGDYPLGSKVLSLFLLDTTAHAMRAQIVNVEKSKILN